MRLRLLLLALSCALVSVPVLAGPPLGCITNSKGQTWCEKYKVHFKRTAPASDPLVYEIWIHPGTIAGREKRMQYEAKEDTKKPALASGELLPWYFENRLYPMPHELKKAKIIDESRSP